MLQIDIKTDLMNYLSCIIKDFEDFSFCLRKTWR